MKLTVIIPVFNPPLYQLLEAIDSIKRQTVGGDSQIICYNDGGNHQYLVEGVQWINSDQNKGTAYALNRLIEESNTEFIARMDADDVCHPDRFKKQIDYLIKHPETDVLGTQLFAFWDDDIQRKSIFTTSHPEKPVPVGVKNPYWLVNHATVIYRKSAVQAVGGYNENCGADQDVELWSRMYQAGYIFKNVNEILFGWRRRRNG